MKFRISEGVSESIYVIGVTKDGSPEGIPKEDLGKVKRNLVQLCLSPKPLYDHSLLITARKSQNQPLQLLQSFALGMVQQKSMSMDKTG